MKKSILLRILVLGVSVYLIFALSSLWRDLVAKEKELDGYKEQASVVKRHIDEYENLLAEGNEKKIIEKAAKERLGYVYADEKVYRYSQ